MQFRDIWQANHFVPIMKHLPSVDFNISGDDTRMYLSDSENSFDILADLEDPKNSTWSETALKLGISDFQMDVDSELIDCSLRDGLDLPTITQPKTNLPKTWSDMYNMSEATDYLLREGCELELPVITKPKTKHSKPLPNYVPQDVDMLPDIPPSVSPQPLDLSFQTQTEIGSAPSSDIAPSSPRDIRSPTPPPDIVAQSPPAFIASSSPRDIRSPTPPPDIAAQSPCEIRSPSPTETASRESASPSTSGQIDTIRYVSGSDITTSIDSTDTQSHLPEPCHPRGRCLENGKFLETSDILKLLLNSESDLNNVPRGKKENVYFEIDNTINFNKSQKFQYKTFSDDCGV